MVEECQADATLDSRHYILALLVCWVWLWISGLAEVRWINGLCEGWHNVDGESHGLKSN